VRSFDALREELAVGDRGLGGGAAAAVALALAADLVATCARRSAADWEDGGAVAAQAGALRRRATGLSERNARTFAAAFAALRPAPGSRPEPLGDALAAAADVLAEIATTAADVAELARLTARHADPDHRADAGVATELAAAAARSAQRLIAVNLAVGEHDERLARARAAVATAVAAATA
jgi:formiminotetrahydrofolate cyclodeaminase